METKKHRSRIELERYFFDVYILASRRRLPGRKRFIDKDVKLGRKVGSVKTSEQMKAEYREVISLLRKGYSIRDVAKLSGKSVSTVQRVKRLNHRNNTIDFTFFSKKGFVQ